MEEKEKKREKREKEEKTTENAEYRYVQLLPVDKKRGYFRKSHGVYWRGKLHMFDKTSKWYRVDAALAEILANTRQSPEQPTSPPVFLVCTEEEARARDKKRQQEKKEKKAKTEPTVEAALDMTEEADSESSSSRSGFSPALTYEYDNDDRAAR